MYYYTTNTGFALIADTEGAKDYTDDQVLAEKTRAEGVEQGLYDDITSIESLIPSSASSSNQLADKAFVNNGLD